MSKIVHFDNLREAFLRASKCKSHRQEICSFRERLDENLENIAIDLSSGTYHFGQYRFFTIYDRKKRTICAAPFRDRVTMHALMRICHPIFDNYQIFDSYASRIGKGTYAALGRLSEYTNRYKWFIKLDACKYFDSISHLVLKKSLVRLFKDPTLMSVFSQLIDGFEKHPGVGLPIGNLTSQYFANHYLSMSDHYAKEQLRINAYLRYMDDIVLLGNDRVILKNQSEKLLTYMSEKLKLTMHELVCNEVDRGVPMLGYVTFPGGIKHLTTNNRKRFRAKLSALSSDYCSGNLSERDYHTKMTALFAYVNQANALPFRHSVMKKQGWFP